MKWLLGLLLGTLPLLAADTLVLHGLTNVTIGQAVYGSNEYRVPAFINLRTNGSDGVSIHLGEADSGVFVHGYVTQDPRSGSFVAGKLYGSIDGETNRLICSMRCHEETDGYHPVEIDFSPLSPSLFTYLAFYRNQLVAQSPPNPGQMVAYGDWFNPLQPRVNPFWRMPDGSIGALIDFGSLDYFFGPSISLPGVGDVRADRLFIRLDEVTNVVDFTSRLDITGGGGVEWLAITDTRLGVFRHAHKALPDTLFRAEAGTLTLMRGETNDGPAVAIETEQAGLFDVTFAPIEFNPGAAFEFTGLFWGPLGIARIARVGESLALSAHLTSPPSHHPTNFQTVIFRQGTEVARSTGTNASTPATARLIGCVFQARVVNGVRGIFLRLDQSIPITLPDQTVHEGDEVRFMVTDSSTFLVLQTIVLNALGMESFKILGELEEPITRPELLITRNSDALTLSWVDPTRIFKLEDASTLGLGFFESGITPAYNGDTASVSFELDGLTGSRFFRLNTQPQPRPEE